MCLVSCPPFSHAVAILMLVLPNDWVEGSQCSPPVSNDDTAQSAPRICVVCIRGFVALEHSIHVGFHATGCTNKFQMEAPLLTAPVFGIQHRGCEQNACNRQFVIHLHHNVPPAQSTCIRTHPIIERSIRACTTPSLEHEWRLSIYEQEW